MVRKAKIKDIPEILELLVEVLNVHHEIRPDLFKENKTKYKADYIEYIIDEAVGDSLEVNHEYAFVYEEEGQILGHIFVELKDQGDNVSYPRLELFIEDLCVKETARNRGIGTSLYNYAKELAKKNGCKSICLQAWNGNTAFEFYQKMGLKIRSFMMEEEI